MLARGRTCTWERRCGLALLASLVAATLAAEARAEPPLYLSFHWHLHQPIYWPYESVVQTEQRGAYSFSVLQVHGDRAGPYTDWPASAIEAGMTAGFEHLGAQVSISGSLIENLTALEAAGWGFSGWRSRWQQATSWQTSLGNPRMELVAFGYHHPLMALIDPQALELQVRLHAIALERTFGVPPAKGMFPPECAFSPRMIPALRAAGIEWILVDSIHLERTHVDYPWSAGSNLVPPNGADVWNDAPTDWVELRDLWAPSPVAAPWAYRPHWAVYLDPETGQEHRIVIVPAARYEGNEDARGGFGALLYDHVFRSYLEQNDDPNHPMLAVLAHDGDNYGAGTESYYKGNFQQYLEWLADNPETFVSTTIQDYLDQFPPETTDTVHVEDGAWSGADNGDAEFAKWNGDPGEDGYSPDRNSWAAITAALNYVKTAEALSPHTSVESILDGNGSDTDLAWRWLLVGQTSCYWYWDGSENGIWDSHPTRAANQAVDAATRAITAAAGADTVAPSIYLPQREPYNPGGYEWGSSPEPEVFDVWTLVYDLSDLTDVVLHYRVDADGCRDAANEVYGSAGWQQVAMAPQVHTPRTDPLPTVTATEYRASVDAGASGVLVDYYVEATDTRGNRSRSPIMHTAVGELGSGTATSGPWEPADPTIHDAITIRADAPGSLHWGVNGWQVPHPVYWPAGTVDYGDGQSVETPLSGPDGNGQYSALVGPFDSPEQPVTVVDFVFHYDDGSWSSPDQHISLASASRDEPAAGQCVPYFRSGTAGSGGAGQGGQAGAGGSGSGANGSGADGTGASGSGNDDGTAADGGGGGCGCRVGKSAPPGALALLAGLLLFLRRRRSS